MRSSHLDSLAAALAARASHYHLHYASGYGACDDFFTIRIEAVVSEIDTDIYQGSSYHV
jgi:hypothetical protein